MSGDHTKHVAKQYDCTVYHTHKRCHKGRRMPLEAVHSLLVQVRTYALFCVRPQWDFSTPRFENILCGLVIAVSVYVGSTTLNSLSCSDVSPRSLSSESVLNAAKGPDKRADAIEKNAGIRSRGQIHTRLRPDLPPEIGISNSIQIIGGIIPCSL